MDLKGKITILILTLIFAPFLSLALELNYPTLPGAPSPAGQGIEGLAVYVYQLAFGFGFLLAISLMLYSAFLYFAAIDDPDRRNKAKSILTSAFLGLFILFASYVILSSVDPALTFLGIRVNVLPKPAKLESKVANPSKVVACQLIPIQQTIEGMQKLEKQAWERSQKIEPLLFDPPKITHKGIMPLIEKVYSEMQNCRCDKFEAKCLTSESWTCPAVCPADQGDPCTKEFREFVAELEQEIERTAKKILELLDSWGFTNKLDENEGELRQTIFEMIMDGLPESPELPNGDKSFVQFLEIALGELLSNDKSEREERIKEIGKELDLALLVQIVGLERDLRRLTEAKMKFDKERADIVQCRADKTRNVSTCAQANEYGFDIGECKEFDFYCCP